MRAAGAPQPGHVGQYTVDISQNIQSISDLRMGSPQHALIGCQSSLYQQFSLLVLTIVHVEVGKQIECAGGIRMLRTQRLLAQSERLFEQ